MLAITREGHNLFFTSALNEAWTKEISMAAGIPLPVASAIAIPTRPSSLIKKS
jgi:hypothetical protein